MLVRGETEPVRAVTVPAWVRMVPVLGETGAETVPVVCAETVPVREEAVPVCAKTTQVWVETVQAWVETVQETVQVWVETVQVWVETVQVTVQVWVETVQAWVETRVETVQLWVETGAETGAGARGPRTAPAPEVRDTDTDRAR